jgi:hypothetical protein
MVIGTAGTVDTGAVDDLEKIGEWWFNGIHVTIFSK